MRGGLHAQNLNTNIMSKGIMKIVTPQEVIDGTECPIPLSIFPNQMGINLCSVSDILWEEQKDGQLMSVSVIFNPS